jgi:hypothetical protein
VDKTKFIETWTFELTPPPFLINLKDAERKRYIRDLLGNAEKEFRAARENKSALGVQNILKQRPLDRPKSSAFRPRIKVFSIEQPFQAPFMTLRAMPGVSRPPLRKGEILTPQSSLDDVLDNRIRTVHFEAGSG